MNATTTQNYTSADEMGNTKTRKLINIIGAYIVANFLFLDAIIIITILMQYHV